MHAELDALSANDTWELVPRPSGKNIVGSKWDFRTKHLAEGSIDRYKARLVAQGFSHIFGFNFSHTFSHVVKAATVRVVLTLDVRNQWPLHQLDVNNAFLHDILNEPVFMAQTPGFIDPRFPHHACCLKKALYGLRQVPRAWFVRFNASLLSLNFHCCKMDTSLFYYRHDNMTLYLLLYVDDIIVTGNDQEFFRRFIDRTKEESKLRIWAP